jgi:P-type E1-E2 ATPase
MGAEA